MPVPALASMARRYGLPLSRLEEFWHKAKAQYDGDYEAVMGTVKKMARNASKGGRKAAMS